MERAGAPRRAGVAHAASRGVAWMIATSLTARGAGLLGTLIVTRFVAPHVMGDIAAAMILALTTGWLTTWGFGQYAVVKGRGDDALSVTWHATLAYTVVGLVGFGLLLVLSPTLSHLLGAPQAARYLPGFALAAVIRRVGATPERVLTRSLRFRAVAIASAVGELSYVAVATSLAACGWGGTAIVIGNIVQSTMTSLLLIRAAGWRAWATPCRLRWARFVDMLRFGVPLCIQGSAHSASRYWGTLLIVRIFGTAVAGEYSLAYNLADVPAIYIGEQLQLVLMPSLATLSPSRRARAFERATQLLALILFPLAIGLGLVAQPLVALALSPEWQGVAPLLTVLSVLSVVRPITCAASAYMEACGQTGRLMFLELANLALLLGGIFALAPLGVTWAAASTGIAFGLNALAGLWVVARAGASITRMLRGFLQPLIACGAMAVAVLALRRMLGDTLPPWAELASEVAIGALVYVRVALVTCRSGARDLIELARDLLKRRRSQAPASYELGT